MGIVVGDKNRLALELDPDTHEKYRENSNLYLYLNGKKFGESNCNYPMHIVVKHVIENYKSPKHSFPELFKCSAKQIIGAIEDYDDFEFGGRSESGDVFDNEILKSVPYFEEKIDDIDKYVFRYDYYAFDGCRLVTIPSGAEIKICIKDDDTDFCEEVKSTYEEFYGLWVKLNSAIVNKQRNKGN